jgi:hypothetical protein
MMYSFSIELMGTSKSMASRWLGKNAVERDLGFKKKLKKRARFKGLKSGFLPP